MKTSAFFLLCCIIGISSAPLFGQIVITHDDMPSPGDTLRVSITAQVPEGYMQTGNDFTWDFSNLSPMNQRVDSFVDMAQTPIFYRLIFIPEIVANLASPKGNSDFFPGFQVNQYYNFYKNDQDGFFDAGFAFSITGLPFNAKYDQADQYYSFPMDINSNWNSASEVYFNLPGMFYFSQTRTRTSFVDGWGTVTTPFGTFETIRVRSALIQHDSIWVDSLGFGMGINRNITEFKWMAEGKGLPVLQINQEGPFVTATYRDSVRLNTLPLSVSLGPDTTVNKGAVITLHATINGGVPPYKIIWNTLDTTSSITVTMDSTMTFGVVVIDALNTFGSDQRMVSVIAPGVDERECQTLICFPNPTSGKTTIQLPQPFKGGVASVISTRGMLMKSWMLTPGIFRVPVDLNNLSPGIYTLKITSDLQTWIAKVIKQ